MHIIYFHQYFKTPEMVGGTRSYEIAKRLVCYGHHVTMITSGQPNNTNNKNTNYGWYMTEEAGVKVHWLSVPYSNKMTYAQRIKAFWHFAYKSAIYASSISADLVFATSTPLTIVLPAIYTSKCQKIPMVFEVRDLWPELPIAMNAIPSVLIPFAYWLEKFAYKNAREIITLSPGMKDGIEKRGIKSDRIHVISNGCDIELFDVDIMLGKRFREEHDWLKDRPLVVYTGTLGRINGVSYFVEIASEMSKLNSEVRFLIVGEGYEEELVRVKAIELDVLNKNLFIFNKVPKKEIPIILSASTVATSLFIDLPSMWNNSANKFFDALAANRPIMINYSGWQADLLTEYEAGIVVPPSDSKIAAQQLFKFISSEEKLRTARDRASKLANDSFSRDILAKKLEKVLLNTVR